MKFTIKSVCCPGKRLSVFLLKKECLLNQSISDSLPSHIVMDPYDMHSCSVRGRNWWTWGKLLHLQLSFCMHHELNACCFCQVMSGSHHFALRSSLRVLSSDFLPGVTALLRGLKASTVFQKHQNHLRYIFCSMVVFNMQVACCFPSAILSVNQHLFPW